jgi:hypothetical protein
MARDELASVAASSNDPANPSRRGLLEGLLTAYTASLIPWALAQPVPHIDRGAFAALSAILVGRQALDAAQTARLYDDSTAEFLSSYMKELHLFIERVLTVLPRES